MKVFQKHERILLLIVALLLTPAAAVADEVEIERLAKLAKELEFVRALTERLYDIAIPLEGERLTFKYDVLIDELERLERGVRQHIELHHSQPKNRFFIGEAKSLETDKQHQ